MIPSQTDSSSRRQTAAPGKRQIVHLLVRRHGALRFEVPLLADLRPLSPGSRSILCIECRSSVARPLPHRVKAKPSAASPACDTGSQRAQGQASFTFED